MKLAMLLVSLLLLATTPMIEAKKKPDKPDACNKECKKYDTSGVQPEGDGSVGTLPCKCEKPCSPKEGSKKECMQCKLSMLKCNKCKRCLKKGCIKKCIKKCKWDGKCKKECIKKCKGGKGKD